MKWPHDMEWLNLIAEVTSVLMRLFIVVGLVWFIWFLALGGWR